MEINLYHPEIPGSEEAELEAIESSIHCGYLIVSSADDKNYGSGTIIKIPIHICKELILKEDMCYYVTFTEAGEDVIDSPILDYMFI